jgi:hypothetical protein
MGLRFQNRVAQSSLVHRAVPGRRNRRWRNSARHFHHGRQTRCHHGFAALRADHPAHPLAKNGRGGWGTRYRSGDPAQKPFRHGRRGERCGLLRQLLWRAQRRRRSQVRELLLRQSAGQCVRAGTGSPRSDFLCEGRGRGQSRDLRRLEDRARRHSRRDHGQRGVQRRV